MAKAPINLKPKRKNTMINDLKEAFPVGTKYIERAYPFREYTVVDHLRTYNDAGELTAFRYVAEHEFMGQTVRDCEVSDVTIRRALADEKDSLRRKVLAEKRGKTAFQKKCERRASITNLSRQTGLSIAVLQRMI